MLPAHPLVKKAPLVGAFFLFTLLLSPASANSCSPPQNTEPVEVRYVHDGDTLVLKNNRKIRLIGINTPEVAHKGRPNQALAIKARDRLRQLLFQQGNKALLVYGKQIMDRHSRYMVHLWLPSGENLTAELLREGLGWVIAIPPNIGFLDCYLGSENTARSASRGVWNHPDYVAVNSSTLKLRDTGFMRVKGRIIRVNRGGDSTWINLTGRFAIRIPNSDLKWFNDPPGQSWLGRNIEVLGWLYSKKGELRVNIQHPASLRFTD